MSEAVARYRAASEADDIPGMMATLAPDAELISPLSGRMVFRGHDDLRILLTAVYGSMTGLRWREQVGDANMSLILGESRVGPAQARRRDGAGARRPGPHPAHQATPAPVALAHAARARARPEDGPPPGRDPPGAQGLVRRKRRQRVLARREEVDAPELPVAQRGRAPRPAAPARCRWCGRALAARATRSPRPAPPRAGRGRRRPPGPSPRRTTRSSGAGRRGRCRCPARTRTPAASSSRRRDGRTRASPPPRPRRAPRRRAAPPSRWSPRAVFQPR